jgi:hypothetical protein
MTTEIEWRRQWKPNLTSISWQPLNIDGDIYLIKCKFTQDSYEILLTDLTNGWYEELFENSLKKRVQVIIVAHEYFFDHEHLVIKKNTLFYSITGRCRGISFCGRHKSL